jgi:hypothetical protein
MLHLLRSVLALAILAEWGVAQNAPIPFCFPTVNGVMGCPCGNPPANPGSQGCNNFGDSHNGNTPTGGGILGGHGQASIANDSIRLDASSLNPSTFALLLESRNANLHGIIYGAGIRCVTSPIVRVYGNNDIRQTTSNGDTQWGWNNDPPLSGAIGALPGDITYFQAWYRDPNAFIYCQNTAVTFNVTNALSITWAP